MAKKTTSSNGRTSKQIELYDRLTSTEYARTIKERRDMKSNLDHLQRKEEDYHNKLWKDRKKSIEEWYKIDEINQEIIDEIVQDQSNGHAEGNLDGENE